MSDSSIPPIIILVAPQLGENIGAAARIMANMGLRQLRLVNPREGWPNDKAIDMAVGAFDHLDPVRVYNTLDEALEGISTVYAASARRRDMAKTMLAPKDMVEQLINAPSFLPSAILFGPERTGLTNEDVSKAHYLVTIPINPAFPSINLAQSVALLCYHWSLATEHLPDAPPLSSSSEPASQGELLQLITHLENALSQKDFFKAPDKKPGMMVNIRNIFTRMPLTNQDVRTLRGIIRCLTEEPR